MASTTSWRWTGGAIFAAWFPFVTCFACWPRITRNARTCCRRSLTRRARESNSCQFAASRLEPFCDSEFADDSRDVSLVGIYLAVQVAHLVFRNFPGEVGKSGSQLRESFERCTPDNWHGVIRREIMPVVF